jgi:hypothetical protein
MKIATIITGEPHRKAHVTAQDGDSSRASNPLMRTKGCVPRECDVHAGTAYPTSDRAFCQKPLILIHRRWAGQMYVAVRRDL